MSIYLSVGQNRNSTVLTANRAQSIKLPARCLRTRKQVFIQDLFASVYFLANACLPAIISVYDKLGLLDLAKGLIKHNVRLLASGGTAKMIRESGFDVE